MLEHLFGSKTRLKLLKTFFREQERSFYVRELTRIIDAQINAIRRELELLVKSGLVQETESPRNMNKAKAGASLRKYYRINSESILYPEMDALLIKAQALGQEEFIADLQKKAGDVRMLVLSGIFTNDPAAQTDILIVGDVKERSLAQLIKKYEKDFGCDLRFTTMILDEFFDRRHMMDKFLYSIFESKHMKVVDKLDI
ncbi:MAG: hypothetical protein ABII02_00090 [Candidatus Magasanikbacteria bacterium]